MSQDIVERLRCFGYGTTNPEVCKEAADTIESLRARVAELETEFNQCSGLLDDALRSHEDFEQQIAAQALTIKTMREAIGYGLIYAPSGSIARDIMKTTLALPDNSTEILQEWLDKQLGEPVGCEWQPIETAPKDCTEILAITAVGQMVVFYEGGYWREKANFMGLKRDPTHWMPLPPPPEIN